MKNLIIPPKFMKKTGLLLFFGMLALMPLAAQNVAYTMFIEPPAETPCTDDEFCIDVTVKDFSNIASTDFDILWDAEVLELTGVTGLGAITGLTEGNFDLSGADTGVVEVIWEIADCSTITAGEGITLDDENGTNRPVVFQLCFRALANYGGATEITIGPDRYTTKDNSGCVNIPTSVVPSIVSTCVRPFVIDISNEQSNEGELVCMDFKVSGFDDLTGFQFPIVWDSTLAVFENILIPGNLNNLGQGSFGVPGQAAGVPQGVVTVSWNAPTPDSGVSVEDSTLIFQLCLRLKEGSCNREFEVSIADVQPGQPFFRPQASNNFENGFSGIAVGNNPGTVTVGPCNPTGLQLTANCGPSAELNDQLCVQVLAGENFQDVTDLAFLMEWNPSILSYSDVQGFTLPGLAVGDFNAANASNGILGFAWDGNAVDKAPGDVLFEVCFDVTGLGGNSPFRFINNENDLARINNGSNIGINPTNCEVEVSQPDGVVIDISDDIEGRLGDTLCFDFNVSNFVDVDTMQFSLAFEPAKLKFLLPGGIQNLSLPGATNGNFGLLGVSGGQVTFSWSAATPVTLADGETIFSLCFEIVGDPGECDQLQIVDLPIVPKVTTVASGGENVGLTGTGGNACILSPEGFYLEIGNVRGDIQDTLCVPVKVSDFDGILSGDFTLNWNPGALELIDVNDLGQLPGLDIGIGGQPVGNASFNFSSPTGIGLADSTVVFELCFELLGPPDTCYAITISEDPIPVVSTVNGEGSLLNLPGEVCINDKLFITEAIIVPESCPGVGDGSVQLSVSGGEGQYIYSWQTQPPQFSPEARFLSEGQVVVTILDQSSPPLRLTDTFQIEALGADLFVNAGPDKVSSCSQPCTFISPTASQGEDITYSWAASAGGQICSPPNDRVLLGRGPGTFVLRVRDENTGCSVTDTVKLLEPVLPVAEAGEAEELSCAVNEVQLDGSASEQGDTIRYTWIAPDGTTLVSGGAAEAITTMAADSGMYTLQVEILTTGCSATDSVLVGSNTILPLVSAGPVTDTTFLGCNDVANLEGFVGDDPENIELQWTGQNGNVLANTLNYTTDQAGVYILTATNILNGCSNSDSTVVAPDTSVPVVEIVGDPFTDFTCISDEVKLRAIVSNVNPDAVTFEWAASNGGVIEPGTENSLSPTITAPGTFDLLVISEANQCEASASIEVGEDTTPPMVDAGAGDTLTCNQETVMLSANAPAPGQTLEYLWSSIDLGEVVDTTQTIEVGRQGAYRLRVTDAATGCVAFDTVMVTLDTMPPPFSAGFPPAINCAENAIEIRTLVEAPEGSYTIQWQAFDGGNIVQGQNDTVLVVDAAGTYELTVTSLASGCSGTLTRTVESEQEPPVATIANPMIMLDCFTPLDTVDATASSRTDTANTITYQWNVLEGAQPIGPLNRNTLQVERGGVYELVVINEGSQCAARDTVVVTEDKEVPQVEAGEPFTLDCTQNDGMLDGTGSSTGDNLSYLWATVEGDTIAQSLTAPIQYPGAYRLFVFNSRNGCSASDVVLVDADGVRPQVIFGAPTNVGVLPFDCSMDTVAVSYTIAPDTLSLSDLVIEWQGDIQTTEDPLSVNVYTPGVFTITVRDTSNGCVGENELVVEDERILPDVATASDSSFLTCVVETVTLDGSGSSQGDNFTYEWLGPEGNTISQSLQVETSAPGTYQLIVTDTTNGCSASKEAAVLENFDRPAIDFEEAQTFQCRDNMLTLSAAPSGDPSTFENPVWATVDGGNINAVEGTLTAEIDAPGTYQLTLTSAVTGCDSTAAIEVMADTVAPTITLAEPPLFGCPGQTVSLDASQSGSNGDFESINWSVVSGGGGVSPMTGSLMVDVTDAGTYQLTVVSARNGCEATREVQVEMDPNTPMAVASADGNIIGCGELITLDASQSSQGPQFTYTWISVSGAPDPIDGLASSVSTAGSYQLIVANTESNCSDTSAVLEIMLDPSLEQATARVDETICGDAGQISGNLPADASGKWTSLGSATVTDEAAPTTEARGLLQGENLFVWSLSKEGCPNYSSDTLAVIPEMAPLANNDMAIVPEGENMVTLEVAANDLLDGVSDWTVRLSADPKLGTVTDEGDGALTYNLATSLLSKAEDEFSYEICNALCPELCDEAFVQISIERDSAVEFGGPNAITPNGDGLNDEFIFDELLFNPEQYPDNELIIFNRWGDIVYTAKPYNNDWRGTSDTGDELPDGTYYYVLRLNIGEGIIIRGDVTLLKARQ